MKRLLLSTRSPEASSATRAVGERVRRGDRTGWTLIDAGLRGSAWRIRRWAASHLRRDEPPAIVLTHAHFDHVGALDELLESWDVSVYAHREERP